MLGVGGELGTPLATSARVHAMAKIVNSKNAMLYWMLATCLWRKERYRVTKWQKEVIYVIIEAKRPTSMLASKI